MSEDKWSPPTHPSASLCHHQCYEGIAYDLINDGVSAVAPPPWVRGFFNNMDAQFWNQKS